MKFKCQTSFEIIPWCYSFLLAEINKIEPSFEGDWDDESNLDKCLKKYDQKLKKLSTLGRIRIKHLIQAGLIEKPRKAKTTEECLESMIEACIGNLPYQKDLTCKEIESACYNTNSDKLNLAHMWGLQHPVLNWYRFERGKVVLV